MLNPADILDALVAKLKVITTLVDALGGDATNIVAYHDAWPASSYLQTALIEMKAPGILAVWRDTSPGNFGRNEVWKHTFSLIIRPPEAVEDGPGYGDIFAAIVNGIPTGSGVKLLNDLIHSGCYPMDVPTFTRQTIVVSAEASLDYFEIRITLTENGDN